MIIYLQKKICYKKILVPGPIDPDWTVALLSCSSQPKSQCSKWAENKRLKSLYNQSINNEKQWNFLLQKVIVFFSIHYFLLRSNIDRKNRQPNPIFQGNAWPEKTSQEAVFRIQIREVLGLPDPFIRGTAPIRIRILPCDQAKIV